MLLGIVGVDVATSEYLATIVLDLTAHISLKNEECTGINYREWPCILKFRHLFKKHFCKLHNEGSMFETSWENIFKTSGFDGSRC